MFILSVLGLIICLAAMTASLVTAWIFRPDNVRSRNDRVLYLLFHLSVVSSVWGLAAPRIGSAVTTFRVAILLFAILYAVTLIRRRENPLKGLKSYQRLLFATMGVMAAYGFATLLFFTGDRGYTFSRLSNLCLDILLCVSVVLYGRRTGMLHSLMMTLTVTLAGQTALAVAECFTGPIYTDTHMSQYGPSLFGLYNLRLPSGPTYNTNDFSAALFFMGVPVIAYWLYRLFSGRSRGAAISIVIAIFSTQWFVSYCGGAILVQIALLLLFLVVAIAFFMQLFKGRKTYILYFMMVPLLAIVLQIAPTIDMSVKNVTPNDSILSESAVPPTPGGTNRDDFTGIGMGSKDVLKRTIYYRSTLLKFTLTTLADNPMGVGLGNTQKLAEARISEKVNGISKMHCYGAECMADFGIPFVLCLLAFALLYLKHSLICIRNGRRNGHRFKIVYIILLLVSFPAAVFASTAPSCAQDLMAMWIYFGLSVVMLEAGTREAAVPETKEPVKTV